jgi:hypothetical protein
MTLARAWLRGRRPARGDGAVQSGKGLPAGGAAVLLSAALAACAGSQAYSPADGGTPFAVVEARQLPGSEVGRGRLQFDRVWLADPTGRYPHGVFGTPLAAESLLAVTRAGETYQVSLPPDRVFEDLVPRVVDLDRDGLEEILVVESDRNQGASLAVYGTPLGQKRLVKLGATPFAGQAMRWLHPLGAGDFDGDNWLDLAVVESPDIGGTLVLYRYQRGQLSEFARFPGVSTHRLGTRELATTRIVRGTMRDHLVIPDPSWRKLLLLSWRPTGIHRLHEWPLPGRLARLDPPRGGRITAVLADGQTVTLELPPLD